MTFADEYVRQIQVGIRKLWGDADDPKSMEHKWQAMGHTAESEIAAGKNVCYPCSLLGITTITLSRYATESGPWVCPKHAQQGWKDGLGVAVVSFDRKA